MPGNKRPPLQAYPSVDVRRTRTSRAQMDSSDAQVGAPLPLRVDACTTPQLPVSPGALLPAAYDVWWAGGGASILDAPITARLQRRAYLLQVVRGILSGKTARVTKYLFHPKAVMYQHCAARDGLLIRLLLAANMPDTARRVACAGNATGVSVLSTQAVLCQAARCDNAEMAAWLLSISPHTPGHILTMAHTAARHASSRVLAAMLEAEAVRELGRDVKDPALAHTLAGASACTPELLQDVLTWLDGGAPGETRAVRYACRGIVDTWGGYAAPAAGEPLPFSAVQRVEALQAYVCAVLPGEHSMITVADVNTWLAPTLKGAQRELRRAVWKLPWTEAARCMAQVNAIYMGAPAGDERVDRIPRSQGHLMKALEAAVWSEGCYGTTLVARYTRALLNMLPRTQFEAALSLIENKKPPTPLSRLRVTSVFTPLRTDPALVWTRHGAYMVAAVMCLVWFLS